MASLPLILGHRGSPRVERENTLESFRSALAEGAEGIETDVRRLRDGSIVLFHDAHVHGFPVENLTLGELELSCGHPVERLAALESLAGRMLLDLEVKQRGWEAELLEQVGDWPGLLITSFDFGVLTRLRELGWGGELGALIDGAAPGDMEWLGDRGVRYLLPADAVVTAPLVERATGEGIEVVPWTVNDPVRGAELVSWGCSGLITDLPRLMAVSMRPEGTERQGLHATLRLQREGMGGSGDEAVGVQDHQRPLGELFDGPAPRRGAQPSGR